MEMPEDVIVEILSRIAVKSLLRFKCVCKHWRGLISSRAFAYLHLNHSISNPKRHSILFQEKSGDSPILPLDPVSFAPLERSNLELDRFTKYGMPFFVGSINGLVCLEIFFRKPFAIAILNPSTGFVKQIRTKALRTGEFSTGFGWDPTTNDYKVFRVCHCSEFWEFIIWVQVWSGNLQYWREYKLNRKIKRLQCDCKLIMEGFTYFLVNDRSPYGITEPELLIACFDVKKEVLRFIPIPQLPLDSVSVSRGGCGGNSSCFLMNWKGTFALVSLVESTKVYQLWTMDDDRVGTESWSKKFTFEIIDAVPNTFATSINGINGMQVLLGLPGELILYNLETRETRKIKSSRYRRISVHRYVESLLSIPWIPKKQAGTKTNEIAHIRGGSRRLNIHT